MQAFEEWTLGTMGQFYGNGGCPPLLLCCPRAAQPPNGIRRQTPPCGGARVPLPAAEGMYTQEFYCSVGIVAEVPA